MEPGCEWLTQDPLTMLYPKGNILTMSKQILPSASDVVRRAYAAWFRSGGHDMPSESASDMCVVEGKHYVTLRNVNGVLACYRITNQDQLKRLKRLPKEILED